VYRAWSPVLLVRVDPPGGKLILPSPGRRWQLVLNWRVRTIVEIIGETSEEPIPEGKVALNRNSPRRFTIWGFSV